MARSLYVPAFVRAKTPEELRKMLLKVQFREGGKVSIIGILQDVKTGEWICWYYPMQSLGGGVM